MEDIKMADRVDFDDDDEDQPTTKDHRAVTCRYDMAKLRKIGEVSFEIFGQHVYTIYNN